MDIDMFISEVFLRPPIWDKRQKNYTNRGVVDSCWREISGAMGVDDLAVRKKWKYLRDQFSVECGKVKAAAESGDEPYEPTWPHYNALLFLIDVIKPRASTSTLKSLKRASPDRGDSYMVHENDDGIHDYEVRDACQDDAENKGEDKSTTQDNPKKRRRTAVYTNYSERFDNRQPDTDEDWCFFRSLLSHVRKVPDRMKLRFRDRVLQLVDEFAYPAERSLEAGPIVAPELVDTYMLYENSIKVETSGLDSN